ncbi:hypothetical protein B0A48_16280 [Cryoendolithus antarcticus]|uniref:Pentatricopeptide repeat protein n=1 Tax=Cryoendolithus antarcticus TaxID=1507870 RepID=A0A1V8SFR8_9PEZI|nr:hypothetical protein B0A48_16280 [Cryoendolithus antarcticus]
MIPSSPARPRIAPSTATLKVLYQLAYISSGTVLGVGALCAEERRRRTKIVQRIADNAQRIRQSPRYSRGSHSAAAVSEVVDEGVYPWGGIENAGSARAYAGPHLPSVVEKEYGEVAKRKGKVRWTPAGTQPRATAREQLGRTRGSAAQDRATPQAYDTDVAKMNGRQRGSNRRPEHETVSKVKLTVRGTEHKRHSLDAGYHVPPSGSVAGSDRGVQALLNSPGQPGRDRSGDEIAKPRDTRRAASRESADLSHVNASTQLLAPQKLPGAVARGRTFNDTLDVPHNVQHSADQRGLDMKIVALRAEWKATQNLDSVCKSYAAIRAQSSASRDSNGTRALDFAMVEIYLKAGSQGLALELLARLNAAPRHGPVGVMLMLAFAKSRRWTAFQDALELLNNNPSLVSWTVLSTRVFNQVIHQYATHHSATQVSDFVIHAMQKFGFVPNVTTFNVVLSKIVAHKDIALTQHWLHLRKQYIPSQNVDITSFAARLLRTWYSDFRHSHVMVMWYCRTLLEEARAFRSGKLLDVVLEAVGRDLRKLAGANAPWMGDIIRQRLEMVQSSTKTVPAPGVIHHRELRLAGAQHPSLPGNPSVRYVSYGQDGPSMSVPQSLVPGRHNGIPVPEANIAGKELKEDIFTSDATGVTSTLVDWSAHPIEAIKPLEPDAPPPAVFSELRHVYSSSTQAAHDSESATDAQQPRRLRSDRAMMLAFSLADYRKVIDIYESSRDAAGLPISPIALEQAVESSIRLYDSTFHAESILASARTAGMNISLCTAPLLIHQLRSNTHLSRAEANHIRLTTLAYYADNDARNLQISPHLGTAAAHALVTANFPSYALNLLSSIYHPDTLQHRTLDIATMSVWLLAYAALQHVPGMQWVVDTVLQRNIQIDVAFLRNLKRAKRPTHRLPDGGRGYGRQEPAVQYKIETWRESCRERRARQMWESKVFGRKLVRLLVRDVNEQTTGGEMSNEERFVEELRAIRRTVGRAERRAKRGQPRKREAKSKRLAAKRYRRARDEEAGDVKDLDGMIAV